MSRRQTYDTREEMRAKYPKGTELNIRCFTSPNTQEPIAVILDDNDDKKLQMMYTLAAFLGGLGLAVGYQLLMYQWGR